MFCLSLTTVFFYTFQELFPLLLHYAVFLNTGLSFSVMPVPCLSPAGKPVLRQWLSSHYSPVRSSYWWAALYCIFRAIESRPREQFSPLAWKGKKMHVFKRGERIEWGSYGWSGTCHISNNIPRGSIRQDKVVKIKKLSELLENRTVGKHKQMPNLKGADVDCEVQLHMARYTSHVIL